MSLQKVVKALATYVRIGFGAAAVSATEFFYTRVWPNSTRAVLTALMRARIKVS